MIFINNVLLLVLLLGVSSSAIALPLTEDVNLLQQDSNEIILPDSSSTKLLQPQTTNPSREAKTGMISQSIFTEEEIRGNDIDLLQSSDYFEDKKQQDRKRLYNAPRGTVSHPNKPGSRVKNASLLSDVVIEPELKEKIKDSLESIKQVKEAFVADKGISYENSSSETDILMQRNLYLQEQRRLQEMKGINNKVSKEKYTHSLFREFFDKVMSFVLYAVLGAILIKLLIMFIAWQRKLNQY